MVILMNPNPNFESNWAKNPITADLLQGQQTSKMGIERLDSHATPCVYVHIDFWNSDTKLLCEWLKSYLWHIKSWPKCGLEQIYKSTKHKFVWMAESVLREIADPVSFLQRWLWRIQFPEKPIRNQLPWSTCRHHENLVQFRIKKDQGSWISTTRCLACQVSGF